MPEHCASFHAPPHPTCLHALIARWTPSQALPAPLDPCWLRPLSPPFAAWHLASRSVAADTSGVRQLDVELTAGGAWCGVAFWAELELFADVRLSTAGALGVLMSVDDVRATVHCWLACCMLQFWRVAVLMQLSCRPLAGEGTGVQQRQQQRQWWSSEPCRVQLPSAGHLLV